MDPCYVVSDLHLFSRRTLAEDHLAPLQDTIEHASTMVFAGDIIDFRWSALGSQAATLAAGRKWLEDCLAVNPRCQFHYVLGNHDYHNDWIGELESLADRTEQLTWNPYHLRIGKALFVHGDAADPKMTPDRLAASRKRFAAHTAPALWKHRAYDATVAARLHVAAARAWYPDWVVLKRLHRYVNTLEPALERGLKRVYFGHTHRAVNGQAYGGLRFHNGGAPMPGMAFEILRAELS